MSGKIHLFHLSVVGTSVSVGDLMPDDIVL